MSPDPPVTVPAELPVETHALDLLDPGRGDDPGAADLTATPSPASSGEPAAARDLLAPVRNRTARAAATWIASTLYTVVTLCVAFVTTPLLLRYLGQERLGAYRAATEWIGYISLIDLGITPALGVLILRARASGSSTQTVRVIRSGIVLLTVIAALTAGVGLVLAGLMPRLVNVSPGLRHELVVASTLLVVPVFLLPVQMSRMLLEAEQRGYWVNFALLCQAVTAAVLSVWLARRGLGLVAQSAALVIGTAVGASLYVVPTWRWVAIRPHAGPSTVTARSIWNLGWPLAVSGLGVRLNLMTDSLVVGYLLGPVDVFHLFVTQRVVSLFGGQVNSVVNASWAALAEMRLTGRQDAFVAGIVELTRLVVGTGIALTGTVAAFNGHFVRLWVGASHYGGDLLSYLTALASVVVGLTTVYGFSLDSAGETAARIPVSIAGAVGNLALSITLTKWLGLPGVILGTVLALVSSDTWFCPFQVSRRFGVPGRSIAGAVVGGAARGLPWVVVAHVFARLYYPASWVTFAAESCVGGCLTLAYTWMVVLSAGDRQRWAARVGGRLPRLARRRTA